MIFVEKRLIYLHVQKTGGNAISTMLLPHSDDEKFIRRHQDGINRFAVKGEFTARKHAKLQDYRDRLGEALDEYKVALPVRDPVERAVSLYFSPSRWMTRKGDGWEATPPHWDVEKFEKLAQTMFKLVDFVTVDGAVQKPDYLVRFSQMGPDLDALCQAFDFPVRYKDVPVANVSVASSDDKETALADPRTNQIIQENFKADYALLEQMGGL